ncbi:MAG: hypothetical protein JW719_04140 [Pirellulales bacterium]|nr:hypothetical protein [Pirellulales bacterium]
MDVTTNLELALRQARALMGLAKMVPDDHVVKAASNSARLLGERLRELQGKALLRGGPRPPAPVSGVFAPNYPALCLGIAVKVHETVMTAVDGDLERLPSCWPAIRKRLSDIESFDVDRLCAELTGKSFLIDGSDDSGPEIDGGNGPRVTYNDKKELPIDASAVALFLEHPNWNKKMIAGHLGCHEKSLAPRRCPKLNAAIRASRAKIDPSKKKRRGSKDAVGNLEAWEE